MECYLLVIQSNNHCESTRDLLAGVLHFKTLKVAIQTEHALSLFFPLDSDILQKRRRRFIINNLRKINLVLLNAPMTPIH